MVGRGAATLARAALPSSILVEQEDGIYWVRDADLERVKKLLGLRVEGVAAGFDAETWSAYAAELHKKKVAIGMRKGNVVRVATPQSRARARPLCARTVHLEPS